MNEEPQPLKYEELNQFQKDAINQWWTTQNKDEYEFIDNFRFANKGNSEQEAAYAIAWKDGCCGFVDVNLLCSDNTILMYGFNYGH